MLHLAALRNLFRFAVAIVMRRWRVRFDRPCFSTTMPEVSPGHGLIFKNLLYNSTISMNY